MPILVGEFLKKKYFSISQLYTPQKLMI
jgi:hypothetical protein